MRAPADLMRGGGEPRWSRCSWRAPPVALPVDGQYAVALCFDDGLGSPGAYCGPADSTESGDCFLGSPEQFRAPGPGIPA